MDEYISRDAVLRTFIEGDGHDDERFTEGYNFAVQEHRDEIMNIKSAGVQPIKHGRWIKKDRFWNKNTVQCSLCGNYLDMDGVNGGRCDANFCPNCGARMIKDGDTNG